MDVPYPELDSKSQGLVPSSRALFFPVSILLPAESVAPADVFPMGLGPPPLEGVLLKTCPPTIQLQPFSRLAVSIGRLDPIAVAAPRALVSNPARLPALDALKLVLSRRR